MRTFQYRGVLRLGIQSRQLGPLHDVFSDLMLARKARWTTGEGPRSAEKTTNSTAHAPECGQYGPTEWCGMCGNAHMPALAYRL